MSSDRPDNDSALSQKCERLEDLLRQALILSSEIAQDQAPNRNISLRHLQGDREHITKDLKSSALDPAGANQHQARHIFPGTQNDEAIDPKDKRGEDTQTPSPPASTVQEPFSPGTLALSLDAMVEGDTPDGDCASSCCLDSSGLSSSSSTTKKSSLSSIEEALEPGALVSPSALLQTTSPPDIPLQQQRRVTPPSRGASGQKPATSHQDTNTDTDTWDPTADASPSPTERGVKHDETAAGKEPSIPPSDV